MKLTEALARYSKVRRSTYAKDCYIFLEGGSLLRLYLKKETKTEVVCPEFSWDDFTQNDWEEYNPVEQKGFLEAVKTWEKFRRLSGGTDTYLTFEDEDLFIVYEDNNESDYVVLSKEDVFAIDWIEVK